MIFRGIEISLAVCVFAAWTNMYYFLMGFDSTGPFVLKIYRIISKDVPYFLQFYVVILAALASALSMLTNDGNPAPGAGFFRFILTLWTLLKLTVNGSDDYNVLGITNVPNDLQWFYDIVYTAFSVVAVLLLINILIAIIGDTYQVYSDVAYDILLMEKCNIMAAQELCSSDQLNEKNKGLYSIRTPIVKIYADTSYGGNSRSHKGNETATNNNDKAAAYESVATEEPKVDLWYFKLEEIDEGWWERDEGSSANDSNANTRVAKTVLLILDPQNSFHPAQIKYDEGGKVSFSRSAGSLAVEGANEDSARVARMIMEHMNQIDEIYVSMDTHNRYDIGHGIFWRMADGTIPPPFFTFNRTDIESNVISPAKSEDDVQTKKLRNRCITYARNLHAKGIPNLIIWPEHCLIGSHGHHVVDEINEALQAWAKTTRKVVNYIVKGVNPYTEMYSALKAEVEDPADKSTALNTELIGQLRVADRILICGEALSHTVNYTCRDLCQHLDTDRMYLLLDGTSPVPGFESQAKEFVQWAINEGVNVVKIADIFNESLEIPGSGGAAGSAAEVEQTKLMRRQSSRRVLEKMLSSSRIEGRQEYGHRAEEVLKGFETEAQVIARSILAEAALSILRTPENSQTRAGVESEMERLGIAVSDDLVHLKEADLRKIASFLKRAQAPKFLACFGYS